jgi:hypothetical protein
MLTVLSAGLWMLFGITTIGTIGTIQTCWKTNKQTKQAMKEREQKQSQVIEVHLPDPYEVIDSYLSQYSSAK